MMAVEPQVSQEAMELEEQQLSTPLPYMKEAQPFRRFGVEHRSECATAVRTGVARPDERPCRKK